MADIPQLDLQQSQQAFESAAYGTADGFEEVKKGMDKLLKTVSGLEKELNNLPKTLKSITDNMNKNVLFSSKYLNDSFVKGIVDSYRLEVKGKLGDVTDELAKNAENAQKALDLAQKNSKDAWEIDKAQKIKDEADRQKREWDSMNDSKKLNFKLLRDVKSEAIKTIKNVMDDIFSYAKQLMNQAYEADLNTIESNADTITSYNSYSRAEYTKILNDVQEQIKAAGLSSIVNINDVTNNITSSLKSGMQGQLAQMNAYYASVAETMGITMDWFGSDWAQNISQMWSTKGGDAVERLMQGIITTTDGLAEYYKDSTGLANGKAAQIGSFASSLAQTYGLSDEAALDVFKGYAVASQEFSKFGIETSGIMSDLESVLKNGLANGVGAGVFGTNGMTGAQMQQALQEGRFSELISNYATNMVKMYAEQNPEMINALGSSLGGSLSQTDKLAISNYAKTNDFASNFATAMGATNQTWESIEDEAQEYQTQTEKYQNQMTLWVHDIANYMQQHPILAATMKSIMAGVASIGGILTQYLLNKSLLSGLQGGGNAPDIPRSSSSAILGKAGKLFTAEGMTGVSGFLSSTGAAVAGGAIGGGIAIYDAVKGYKSDGIGGAFKGALTGVNGDVDSTGDIWKIGLKNTAKGAALGTTIGGPYGAAIGAGLGAILGFGTAIAEFNDPLNKATRQLSKLGETAKETEKAQKAYSEAVENSKKTVKRGEKPTSDLLKKFPELTSYLDENGNATSEYVEELKKSLEVEKQLNLIKLEEASKKYGESVYGSTSSYQTLRSDVDTKYKAYQKAKKVDDDRKEFEKLAQQGIQYDEGKDTFTVGTGKNKKTFSGGDVGGFYGWDINAIDWYIGAANIDKRAKKLYTDTGATHTSDNLQSALTDYQKAAQAAGEAKGALESVAPELNTFWSQWGLKSVLDGSDTQGRTFGDFIQFVAGNNMYGGISEKGSFANILSNYNQSLKARGTKVESGMFAPSVLRDKYNEWVGDAGEKINIDAAYASGTRYVPADNYIALLHRGEQVRTAAEVAVDRAERHVASSNAVMTVNDTLIAQTNSIIDVLKNIYMEIKVLKSGGTLPKAISYDLPAL